MMAIFGSNMPQGELVPNSSAWCLYRPERDFDKHRLRGFTARQMADKDCNLYSELIPQGHTWSVKSLSLHPASPASFTFFRELVSFAPLAELELLIAGREFEARVELQQFWSDGEYILHPKQELSQPVNLFSGAQFRVDISFGPANTNGNLLPSVLESFFAKHFPNNVLRASIQYDLRRAL